MNQFWIASLLGFIFAWQDDIILPHFSISFLRTVSLFEKQTCKPKLVSYRNEVLLKSRFDIYTWCISTKITKYLLSQYFAKTNDALWFIFKLPSKRLLRNAYSSFLKKANFASCLNWEVRAKQVYWQGCFQNDWNKSQG